VAPLPIITYTVLGALTIAKRDTVFNPGRDDPGVFLCTHAYALSREQYTIQAMQRITSPIRSSVAPMRAASATRLLCGSAVKQFTLDTLKDRRPHLASKKTRVGSDFYVVMEARLRSAIGEHIDDLLSVGKTIR
jgi:hypothetical protein